MDPSYSAGLQSISKEYDEEPLTIEGTIPDWLSGVLLRNGPGKFEIGGREVTHWFDGLAYLRRYAIAEGEIMFTGRFLRSEEYNYATTKGELYRDQFGTNIDHSVLRRIYLTLRGGFTDNCVVNIDRWGSSTEPCALTETARAVTFDQQTLKTNSSLTRVPDVDITGALAHVQYDFDRDVVITLGYQFGRRGSYVLLETEWHTGKTRTITTIPVSQPAYIHSFTLTPTHIVVTEPPFRFSPKRALRGHTYGNCFKYDETGATRFFVIDRALDEVVSVLETDPFFVFHHVNAYNQNNDKIVVDLVAYDDPAIIDALTLQRLQKSGATIPTGRLNRYTLNFVNTTVTNTSLSTGPIEFPTIAYQSYNGQPYRYLYGAGHTQEEPHQIQDCITKVDTETGTTTQWSQNGIFVGEPLVVEKPEATAEDDCVLLVPALDTDTERSGLILISGADLSEYGRGMLPTTLPFGFHGQFYTAESIPQRSMT